MQGYGAWIGGGVVGTRWEMCWLAVAVGEAVVGVSVARMWLVAAA